MLQIWTLYSESPCIGNVFFNTHPWIARSVCSLIADHSLFTGEADCLNEWFILWKLQRMVDSFSCLWGLSSSFPLAHMFVHFHPNLQEASLTLFTLCSCGPAVSELLWQCYRGVPWWSRTAHFMVIGKQRRAKASPWWLVQCIHLGQVMVLRILKL